MGKVAAFITNQSAGKMVRTIKDTLHAIGLDGKIEVIEIPRMKELEQALWILSCGGCWCGIGIGDPRMREHSDVCKHIQKLLNSPTIIEDENG